jgi:peptidoglycan/LPS O-acetylase OafA/YrhL
MPVLVISVIMLFIAIFLPWATVSSVPVATGTYEWGTLTTIASIVGIGLAFIVSKQIRAIGLMAVGVLALVGTIIFITRLQGAAIGFGLILEMIASLVAIFIGFKDYPQSTPSVAPPAPPAQP